MLLIPQTGTANVAFSSDKLFQNWAPGSNPDIAMVLVLTNDMSRESISVVLLPNKNVPGLPTEAITVSGPFMYGCFETVASSSGNAPLYSALYIKDRGYYSYELYEHSITGQYPTNALLAGKPFLSSGLGPLFMRVDVGKALVVDIDKYNKIKSGVLAHGERVFSNSNGEVAYTEHTDTTTSSEIDTDNNYIHIN